MNLRRTLIVATVIIGFVGSILAGRHAQAVTATRFSTVPFANRPYSAHRTPITTTWYCAGVPAADNTTGGQIVVANPTDVAINGHITYMNSDGAAPLVQPIVAPARDKLTLDVESAMTGTFVSAIVELDGGEAMVEQRAIHPAGDAVASCTTQTSPTWYFADGWTRDISTEQLVITNPYADAVSFDVTFYSKNGPLNPGAFQDDSVEPRSVKVIDVSLKDESIIGVQVAASLGRLVVARAAHYAGGGRLGYSLNLGAPALSEQLWFAEGSGAADVTEKYVILNPTGQDADVTVAVLGIPQSSTFVAPESIPVPSNSVVTYDTKSITGLPDLAHSMAFSTADGKNSIIIERVLTETVAGQPVTSIVMAMTPEFSFAKRWSLPIGVDAADADAIVVYNPFASAAIISLKTVGPGGEIAVPGSDAIMLPGAGIITIPLTDPSVFGKIVIVDASAGVYVERRLPRGHGLGGRSGSWALPEECDSCNFSLPPSS